MDLASLLAWLRVEPGKKLVFGFAVVLLSAVAGDQLVPIVLLLLGGTVAGWAAARLDQPPLVGMLLAGVAMRNLLPLSLGLPPPVLSGALRNAALGLIMLRAGMSLETRALSAQPTRLGLLAALPCLTEVAAVALLSVVLFGGSPSSGHRHWAGEELETESPPSASAADQGGAQDRDTTWGGFAMPLGVDLKWGALLGFCLADVSPAVAVPLLLDLQRRRFGAQRGVPSVLIAAASLNAVIAIVGFGIFLKLIFADDEEDISNASTSIPFFNPPADATAAAAAPTESGESGAAAIGQGAATTAFFNGLGNGISVGPSLHGYELVSAGDAAAASKSLGMAALEVLGGLALGSCAGWALSLAIETWCTEDSFKANASPSHRLMQPALLQEAGAAVVKRSRGRVSRLLWLAAQTEGRGRGGAANGAGQHLNQYRWGRVADRQQTGQVLKVESHSSGDRLGLIEVVESGKAEAQSRQEPRTRLPFRSARELSGEQRDLMQMGFASAATLATVAIAFILFGKALHMHGGGALAAVSLGAAVCTDDGSGSHNNNTTTNDDDDDDDECRQEEEEEELMQHRKRTVSPSDLPESNGEGNDQLSCLLIPDSEDDDSPPLLTHGRDKLTVSRRKSYAEACAVTKRQKVMALSNGILGSWWESVGVVALFTLLGAAIDVKTLTFAFLGYGSLLVALALGPRAAVTYLCAGVGAEGVQTHRQTCAPQRSTANRVVSGTHEARESGTPPSSSSPPSSPRQMVWSHEERLFAALAWCPKATVQAALSTVALEMVQDRRARGFYGSSDVTGPDLASADLARANAVLTIAVASIFLTAVPFAGLIARCGPRLLQQDAA